MAGFSHSLITNVETYKQKYSNSAIKKLLNALELGPIEEKEIKDILSGEKQYIPEIFTKHKFQGMNKKTEEKIQEIYNTKNKKIILAFNKALDLVYFHFISEKIEERRINNADE